MATGNTARGIEKYSRWHSESAAFGTQKYSSWQRKMQHLALY